MSPVSSLIEEPQVLHTIHRPREIYIYPSRKSAQMTGMQVLSEPAPNCRKGKSLGPREQLSTFEIMQLATEGARAS